MRLIVYYRESTEDPEPSYQTICHEINVFSPYPSTSHTLKKSRGEESQYKEVSY